MRNFLVVSAIGLMAALLNSPPAVSDEVTGWSDLLGHNLKDWTHLGDGKNAWRLSTDHTLSCGKAHDAYAPDNEFADGTLKFDYRFKPTGEKTGYKAAISVRSSSSAPGCKMALGDKCGTISASFLAASDATKELEIKGPEKLARNPGEWNQVKVRMQGKSVTFTINGKPAGSWDRCPSDHGLVIFEAQGSEIDFRNVYWKADR